MKRAVTVCALVMCVWASPAQAKEPVALVDYVGSEGFVASRLELRHFAQDVVSELVDIVWEKYHWRLRQRAVRCLALYRSDVRAYETLRDLLERTPKRAKLFPQVVVSFMEIAGEDGVALVEPLLKSRRSVVRLAAVIGLGRSGGQEGFELLRRAERREKDQKVVARIRAYLKD